MNAAPSCHRSPTAIPAYRISGSPDLILAYFTFGALTREIGTKMKTLIQKGSFGAEFQCKVISDLRRAFFV
jgi:hypothetical protein